MRKILYLLLALLLLTGCKSKKSNRAEHREEQRSERKETKDSSIQVEKSQKVSTFEVQQSQLYEVTLESEKDSAGNAKELVYYRIRDGDSETIRVRNGKVTLKTIDNISKSLQQADSTLVINNQISQKSEVKNQYLQQSKQVQKEVKKTPFAFIIGALILGVVAWIFWKLKPFR
nr:MAG TPA: lipoprotein [Caudoviricetes sp.]